MKFPQPHKTLILRCATFATLIDRVSKPCSPGLPPVPMNRFPFPSHSPFSSLPIQQPPNGVRGEQMCAASAKKLLPKTKPSSPPPGRLFQQRQSGLATGRLELIIWHGMKLSSEQILKEASGQKYLGFLLIFKSIFRPNISMCEPKHQT